MEKKLTKREAVLDYLQTEAVNLRVKFPTLVDARCEKSKLVLVVHGEAIEAPQLTHQGVKLDVVIETTDEEPELTAELSEAAERAKEIRERPGVVPLEGLYIHDAEQAVGPDGNGQRRDQQAYESWKKRFNK